MGIRLESGKPGRRRLSWSWKEIGKTRTGAVRDRWKEEARLVLDLELKLLGSGERGRQRRPGRLPGGPWGHPPKTEGKGRKSGLGQDGEFM